MSALGLLALAARVAWGAIFFLSGRTKVEGFLTITDGAYALFREECQAPLLPPEFAARGQCRSTMHSA